MSFTRWLRNLRSAIALSRTARTQRRSLRAATYQPHLEVLENRIVPAFLAPADYSVGAFPGAVAVADFNNDTALDLAVIDGYGDSYVGVLLGNADGTFQPAQHFVTGAFALSLAVGDFNDDGDLDVATASNSEFIVSVLQGNGDGTFQTPTGIDIGSYPMSVAVSDFNADGKMDLAVTSNVYDDDVGFWHGHANVLLGNGDGSFLAPNTTELGAGFHFSVAVADFNGDLKQDFATINETFGTVRVLLGDGAGNFQTPADFYVGGLLAVAVGDVNGDGKLDLVATNATGVGVLLGDGEGGFGACQYFGVGSSPAAVAVGDFTGDGNIDVAAVNSIDGLSVLCGRGDGAFSTPLHLGLGSLPPVAVGDFNGDGWLDAATANNGGGISVLINDHSWLVVTAPSVSVNDVTFSEGNTGTANATFTLTLSAASDEAITVHYQTADRSAMAGSDYTAASGDVTFAAGDTSQTISITVFGDRLAEPTETFAVNISTTTAFVDDGLGVCTILDDEPNVSITDVTVTEGNVGTVNATFTVSLSAAYDGAVTVNYASANQTALAGSDYQGASGSVAFAVGEITRTITILVNGDTLGELNETFLVSLNTLDAHLTDSQGVGTILGDDPAFIWLNPWNASAWANSGDGGQASSDFSGAGAAGDVGAASATSNAFAQAWGGSDMWTPSSYFSANVSFQRTFQLVGSPTGWKVDLDALLSGTLFARSEHSAYSASSGVSAQVRIIQDTTGAVTHDLNFAYGCTAYGGSNTVNVSAPGSREVVIPDGTYSMTGILETSATGYLVEFVGSNQSYSSCWLDTTIDAVVWDNQPDISVSDATFVEGNSGAATRYFTVTLSNPSTQIVTVDFALADGSATLASNDYGYLNANRTVTFAPGVTQQTIAVRIYGDRIPESEETFFVNLSNPTNARIKDGGAIGTIQNDEPRISISDVSKKEGKNNQTTLFTFTVTLSAAYDQAVTMSYRTVDATATTSDGDYIAKSGTLTFAPGETTKTITIEVKGDSKREASETFYLDLFGNSDNSLFTKNRGIATILNDD